MQPALILARFYLSPPSAPAANSGKPSGLGGVEERVGGDGFGEIRFFERSASEVGAGELGTEQGRGVHLSVSK